MVSIGNDISKKSFEANAFRDGSSLGRREIGNNPAGFREFVEWGNATAGPGNWTCCMESTGGYELPLACYLAKAGITVYVENPLRIKRFAQARGFMNKTDRVDARIIAEYATKMEVRPWHLGDPLSREIALLGRHRQNLLGELNRLTNRLEHLDALPELALKQIKEGIALAKSQILEVEAEQDQVAARSERLGQELQIVQGLPGIGRICGLAVLTEMPDIDSFDSAETWAAQAGGFPKRRESGQFRGVSFMAKSGNGRVRRALYLAVTIAMQTNKVIHNFAERLRAKGKKPKQIRVACMRKLLMLCYGVLKAFRAGKEPCYGEKLRVVRKKKALAT